jgi:hypothetical protein
MHAEMWAERLRDEPRFRSAVTELLPHALGALEQENRPALFCAIGDLFPEFENEDQEIPRGSHTDGWPELWEEMTEVRRSVPGATW